MAVEEFVDVGDGLKTVDGCGFDVLGLSVVVHTYMVD